MVDRVRPSTKLHVEIEKPSGATFRWDANDRIAGNRPQNMSFRTQRGDGFADSSVTLARRIDQDYVDIALLDKMRFVAEDGFIAWEGFVASFPRDLNTDGHSITVHGAGYMASATHVKFSEVYVNRDLGGWRTISNIMRSYYLATVGRAFYDGATFADEKTGMPGIRVGLTGPWALPAANSAYQFDSGGPEIGVVYWDEVSLNTALSGFSLALYSTSDDGAFGTQEYLDSGGVAASDIRYLTLTDPARFLMWDLFYNASSTADGTSFNADFRQMTEYGTHGLSIRTEAGNPGGFYASDVIRNICARFCPQLDTAGVEDTTYVIKHIVFAGSQPYEAFQELNRLHLWELSVWEGGRLYFHEPTPLDDWDWQVRTDDAGVELTLQGDSIEDLANGIVVTYDDFWGNEHVVTPDDEAMLQDDSPDNPCNIWGIEKWIEPPGGKLSAPTTYDDAIQVGRAALGEAAQPKAPGEITVRGHIRDRAGAWQPVHRVRCGERVRIANHPNDRPRRIVDTDWSGDDQKSLRISTDNTTHRVEGFLDRLETARKAASLT